MNTPRVLWILAAAFLLLSCQSIPAAEPAPPDATQFLKQSGLEAIHATYAKYFTLLSEGKAAEAEQVLIDSFPQGMNSSTIEQLRKINDALYSGLARGTAEVELVGALTISSKCAALYYMANGSSGPCIVVLVPYHRDGKWRTHTYYVSSQMDQIMQHLKGITHFPKPLIVVKAKGKTA